MSSRTNSGNVTDRGSTAVTLITEAFARIRPRTAGTSHRVQSPHGSRAARPRPAPQILPPLCDLHPARAVLTKPYCSTTSCLGTVEDFAAGSKTRVQLRARTWSTAWVNLETVDTIRELAGGGVGDPPTMTR